MRTHQLAAAIRAAECAIIDVPGAARYPRYEEMTERDQQRYDAIAQGLLDQHPHTASVDALRGEDE